MRPSERVRRWWRRVLHRSARAARLPKLVVERRRTSTLWAYLCLAGSWGLLTWSASRVGWAVLVAIVAAGSPKWVDPLAVIVSLWGPWHWTVWTASVALFVLVFEVGISYLILAAWHSHGNLELDAESKEVQAAEQRIRRQREIR